MKKLLLIYCFLLLVVTKMNAQEIFDAVNANDFVTVKILVEKDTSLVRMKDPGGNTPLHRAAVTGSLQIAAYIISKGGDVNAKDNRGLLLFIMPASMTSRRWQNC